MADHLRSLEKERKREEERRKGEKAYIHPQLWRKLKVDLIKVYSGFG